MTYPQNVGIKAMEIFVPPQVKPLSFVLPREV
jgi:hypothetical protein